MRGQEDLLSMQSLANLREPGRTSAGAMSCSQSPGRGRQNAGELPF